MDEQFKQYAFVTNNHWKSNVSFQNDSFRGLSFAGGFESEPEVLADAPQSPEQAPPSPDYVPSPEYPKYLAPSDDEIPIKDQPLPADASPTTLLLGYVVDSYLEEDLEENPADYPANGGDEEEEEESSEDESFDDKEEEEEHLAPADSTLAVPNSVPLAEETEPFETD
ncbi:hypothetical protein Tco_1259864 [Tanacetum coccineum]